MLGRSGLQIRGPGALPCLPAQSRFLQGFQARPYPLLTAWAVQGIREGRKRPVPLYSCRVGPCCPGGWEGRGGEDRGEGVGRGGAGCGRSRGGGGAGVGAKHWLFPPDDFLGVWALPCRSLGEGGLHEVHYSGDLHLFESKKTQICAKT